MKLKYLLVLICFVFVNSQSFEDEEPNGIHLVYGDDCDTQMNIFWWTRTKIKSSSSVYYGLVDIDKESLHLNTSICYYNQSTKGYAIAPPLASGKYIQRVLLKNLQPNRLYCYEIKSGSTTSMFYTFRTPQLHTDTDNNKIIKSFIVYGGFDSTTTPTVTSFNKNFQQNILNKFHNNKHNINALIALGDISLKNSTRANGTYNNLDNNDFFDSSIDIFARIPILPVAGPYLNKINQNFYRNAFTFMNEWPLKSLFWYSYDINGIHFISISSELFFMNKNDASAAPDENDEQFDWLNKDLATANKNRLHVPWLIVLMHQQMYCTIDDCPIYCTSTSDGCIHKDKYIRDRLERLFNNHRVDLIFASSKYFYERTYPITNDSNMPIHISVPRRKANADELAEIATIKNENLTAFSYTSLDDFNYGHIELFNQTHLKWSYLTSNNTIIDQILIIKSNHGKIEQQQQRRHEKQQIVFKIFTTLLLTVTCTLCIIIILFILKRYYKIKYDQKYQTHYTNLIESQLDV